MSFPVYYLRIRIVQKKRQEREFIPTQRDAGFHPFMSASLSQLARSSLRAGALPFFPVFLAPGT